jgi:hypothetical protein
MQLAHMRCGVIRNLPTVYCCAVSRPIRSSPLAARSEVRNTAALFSACVASPSPLPCEAPATRSDLKLTGDALQPLGGVGRRGSLRGAGEDEARHGKAAG